MKVGLLTHGNGTARAYAFAATFVLCVFSGFGTPAYAQIPVAGEPTKSMFVTADEVVYDDVRKTSSAVGSVKLYYGDATLEADRVVYDETTSKVYAYGNVRLNDKGSVYQSEHMVLTDDFRDGFVQSLLVEGADRTRFAASRATRRDGTVVVFDKGVYTACKACAENPEKPPLWQVKAARIIHDEGTKTIHYEDARLEFFGKPIAWLPFFSHPDGSVKRKTGFLTPSYMSSTEYGVGARVPFFWNIAPNMDLTVAPTVFSKQGIMPDVEFRHRTISGAYSIRAAGIFQESPDEFKEADQQEDFRGALTSKGEFRINEYWTWGWDANLLSDKWVLDDYDLWGSSWTEAKTTVHLTGVGERNYFELRGTYFYGLSSDDDQDQLPVVGTWDYNYVHDNPIYGGEWAFNVNLTTLYRKETDFEPVSRDNVSLVDGGTRIDPWNARGQNLSCVSVRPEDGCVVRGVGGTYTRLSADTSWRREFIDPIGQVWTPFAFARGDVMFRNSNDNPNLDRYLASDDETLGRGMVGVGLEYRYPFVAESSIGTHLLEPIAQIILRPDETEIGQIPNEDAQSLFFDTSTLFSWDKFSGYDRIEGGSRANLGLQYTLNLNNGGFAQIMFGQSYHLFGENSFAARDLTETGRASGLESDVSDYVASAYFKVNRQLAFASRFRFDEETFDQRALELETTFTKGPVQAGITYGRYEAQPQFGFEKAEGVVASTRLNINPNYFVAGAARYNIETERLDNVMVGAGYLDECFTFGINYAVDYNENGNEDPVHKIFVRLALRTLGEAGTSFDVSNALAGSDDPTR